MITGLAALNKFNRPNTGDDMRYPKPKNDQGANPGGNGQQLGVLPAFMPGQRAGIADQLDMGFGGGEDRWLSYLNQVYSPLTIRPFTPSGPGGNSADVRPGQPQIPKDTKNPMVTRVTSTNYPSDYPTGLIALRGRT